MTQPSKFAISKVQKGNPSIYTLTVSETKRVEKSKIRKLMIDLDGCVAPDAVASKVVMIVGETGSGKTLVVNSLINYVMDVKWQDDYRYKLDPDDTESKKRGHAMSQTEWISAYTLHQHKSFKIPYSLTIIDTPGFGDTAGISKDKEITDQIKFFFSSKNDEGIDQIDAVVFVVQSDKPRLTASQRFIFDCVLSLFGKDVKDNIFLFTTFADQNEPLVLEGMKEASIPYKEYYKFNNSPLFAQKETSQESEECDSDDERNLYNKMFWKSGAKQFEKFFKALGETSGKSTKLSSQVLREREALNVRIQAIPQLIRSNLVTLERLKKEEEVLRASQEDLDKNKDYSYTVTKEVTEKKRLRNGEYAMTCRNCKINCHHPCSRYFKNMCVAFYWFSGCSVCPKKCSNSSHDNKDFIYETNIVEETKNYNDIKARYDTAQQTNLSAKDLVAKVSQEAKDIREAISKHVSEVREIFKRLDAIALKRNPTSTADYLEYLIKTEKSRAEVGWQDRVVQLENMLDEARLQEGLALSKELHELNLSANTSGSASN